MLESYTNLFWLLCGVVCATFLAYGMFYHKD